MHADSHISSHPQHSAWAALLRSKWACLALVAGGLATASSASRADEFNTVLGAGVGAVAGAVIGQSVAGHNGAIIGAGAGGLVGASIAQRGPYPIATVPARPAVVTYPAYPAYPNYRYPAPVAYAPAPAVVVPTPVYAAPQWRPAPRPHHHHHGWEPEYRDYRGYAPIARVEPHPFIDGRGDQERRRGERWD
jgi:hypothetical protein